MNKIKQKCYEEYRENYLAYENVRNNNPKNHTELYHLSIETMQCYKAWLKKVIE